MVHLAGYMYSTLFKNCIFPVVERYQGTTIQANIKYLEKTQWLSPSEIEELQNKKLRSLIRHSYDNVPYYRKMFNDHGIYPDDIKTRQDLPRIPILTKEIIRKNLPDLIAKNFPRSNILERSSSGSTGQPLKYYIDKESYSFGWAQTFRCWSWVGYSLGDNYVKITHPRTTPTKTIQDIFMRCTLIPAFQINEKNIRPLTEKIKRAKPIVLRGFPSSVYLLASLIEKTGIKEVNVRAVMTTGDTLLPEYRNTIEKVFNCKVFDAYGGEGTAVAFECEEHDGYHIAEEGAIVEYLNSNSQPVEGEYGELCITNLTNYAMPFIRYNIQDVGKSSDERCPCGRGLSLLKSIDGRSTDIIITPAKRLLTIHFFSTFLKKFTGILQYQIIQEERDKIRINLVKDGSYQEENTARIIEECRKRIGEDIDIRVEFVDEIPLMSSGKRRFVISKVPLAL